MKIYKTVEKPAQTIEEFDRLKCELCGKETSDPRNWKRRDSYSVNEVTVEFQSGSSYPEGGSGKRTILDICNECFNDKLVPWFKASGGKPRIEDYDY